MERKKAFRKGSKSCWSFEKTFLSRSFSWSIGSKRQDQFNEIQEPINLDDYEVSSFKRRQFVFLTLGMDKKVWLGVETKRRRVMFTCDCKTLRLSFNEFHYFENNDLPVDDEFCLLELKDGSLTAGKWMPFGAKSDEIPAGEFIRGTSDVITMDEVAKWHSLRRYDLSNCLDDGVTNYIDLGVEKDDAYKILIQDFKSLNDGDFPRKEQYCLLIMMDGRLAAGRWNPWRNQNKGIFIYAPALSSYDMDEVWAWTPLSSDRFFARQEELENEIKREEELNRNPSVDREKFIYGIDISVYYQKALEKLKKEYPWATLTQMKKREPWDIVPLHGKYVFGQVGKTFYGTRSVNEWTEGSSADKFIDFLCEYTKESVKNSNPDQRFKFGMDIESYLEKAFEKVKKDYRWLEKSMLGKYYHYAIKRVDGDYEFVKEFDGSENYSICDYKSAEDFIESVVHTYQSEALDANPVVEEYAVPFGSVELNGWWLEKYVFSKLQSGDYKVSVQAGDRTTGAGRDFFITPDCFEAKTYDEFLDRYSKIVPGGAFGLFKEDLLPNEELKSFLGY